MGNSIGEIVVRETPANDGDRLERLVAAGRTTDPMPWGDLHDGLVVAHSLKLAREESGLSLSEVEEISGMDRAQISKLENGRSNPTLATLTRYASALGKRIRVVLDDSEEGPAAPAGRG